ncbi:MAG: hypothetical protein WCP45_01355 [Verrucomicrobiota bacterium]
MSLLVPHASKGFLTLVLVALLGPGWGLPPCSAQVSASAVQDSQVLTRGPLHEAFAVIVTHNPKPGIIVSKTPPEDIGEEPPGDRPEGTHIAWVPGYWAWDDERSEFLWIGGIWRALPPSREWIVGYWGKITQGYQWTSGYWADATESETTYLPEPPAPKDTGPKAAAPAADCRWTPGYWIWTQGSYQWAAGYWAQGQTDWDWTPPHYVWSPRGYIHVKGYWDYPAERRGVVFAPINFSADESSRAGLTYAPRIAIDPMLLAEHLFLRPSYGQYYFGDYYASRYKQGGFVSPVAFQMSRDGYDPVFAYRRWVHRLDRGWENRVASSYQYRSDNAAARPPLTWAAQRKITRDSPKFQQTGMQVAAALDVLAKRKDGAQPFQTVTAEERQQLVELIKAIRQFRENRRTLETATVATEERKPGEGLAPVKVTLGRSPIVGKPANQLGKSKNPPVPQQAQKSESAAGQPKVSRPAGYSPPAAAPCTQTIPPGRHNPGTLPTQPHYPGPPSGTAPSGAHPPGTGPTPGGQCNPGTGSPPGGQCAPGTIPSGF